MIHRILTTVTTLLLLSAISLWIASYLQPYGLRYHRLNTVNLGCQYWGGNFRFFISDATYLSSRGRTPLDLKFFGFIAKSFPVRYDMPTSWHFAWNPLAKAGVRWGFEMLVPFWFLSMLFAVYPSFAIIRSPYRRRHLRRKKGLCLKCGYNLTGNVSGVCPECGERI